MNRLNRRRFLALSSAGAASAVLVACGNPTPTTKDVNPTQIPDVAGAPPTLAPITSTPQSGGGSKPAGGGEAAGGGGGGESAVTIEAGDLYFDPTEFSVAPGGTITLKNVGQLEHDFAVDDWGGVVIGPLNGGDSGDYKVPDDAKVGDTFTFYCSIPGHRAAGMEGTLTIAEAGAAGGKQEEATAASGEASGGGASEVDLTAHDIYFSETEFSIAPGGTIKLANEGMLEHDFAVDDWGGVLIGPLQAGDSGETKVPEDAKVGDTFTYYCSIPGHEAAGMKGTLTIAEAGAGGGAAPEEQATAEGAAEEATAVASPSGEQAATGGVSEVTVAAGDLFFDPTEFEIAPGGTITMNNEGMLEHDFAVDNWGGIVIDVLKGGETGTYTVPDDATPGETFEFYCSIPGHKEAGMVGKLTISAGGSDVAASGGEEEATAESSPEGEAAAGGGASAVAIEGGDIYFDPTELSVAPGGTITMTNAGMLEHDFAVDDWGGIVIDVLKGGEKGEYTIPADAKPGDTFEFYCSIPGHKEAGMVGTLTIAETSAGGGEEAAATGSSDGGEGVAKVTISAFEFGYDPAEVEVSPGTKITMTNDGHIEHDIAVTAWDGEIVPLSSGGASAEGIVPDDAQAGETFEFFCTVAGHKESGMVGKFTVVAGAAGGAAASPESASPEASPAVQGTGNTITIASNEWSYSPSRFDIAPGDTIVLRNDGAMAHDMSSEEWGESFIPDVAHGESGSFVVPDDAKVGSTVEIYSINQGATKLGMKATATIVEKTEGNLTAPPAPSATPAVSVDGTPVAVASGGGKVIGVEAGDLYFDPNDFEASAGDTIKLTNAGQLEHDMASEALGVTMIGLLSAGDSGEYVIPDDASGEIDIYCTVAGHKEAGMMGTITVV